MQACHLFVEMLRETVNSDLVVLPPQLHLRQHLIGEGVAHHEGGMPRSAAQVHQASLGQEEDGVSVLREGIFVHLRLDVQMADTGIVHQAVHLYLIIEVSDVADDGLVFHRLHVLQGDDVAVARGGYEDIAFLHGLFHRRYLESLHRGLQGTDGVYLRDKHPCAVRPHRVCAAFAYVAIARHDYHLPGYHHIGGTLDAIGEGLAATVQIVELRLRNRIIYINGRDEQLAPRHHLIEAVHTGSRLLGDSAHLAYRAMPPLGVLSQHTAQYREDASLLVIRRLVIQRRRVFLCPISFVQEERSIAAIIHDEVRSLAPREAERHLRTPPILLEALALPGIYRDARRRYRSRGMVLCGEDVAACPADIRAEGYEGFNQHGGLDGHVQRAGDARPTEGFLVGILAPERHQPRHLVFGYLDFLAAELRQTHIFYLVRQVFR